MTHYETHRNLLVDPYEAYSHVVHGLPTIRDVEVLDVSNPVLFKRATNMIANRWEMTGSVTIQDESFFVEIDGAGSMHAKFVKEILNLLPEGSIDDHGIPSAVSRLSRTDRFLCKTEIEELPGDLFPGEEVILVASATLDGKAGMFVLTSHRVLLKVSRMLGMDTTEFDPQMITSLSVGKKLLGDAVTIGLMSEVVEVTGLQDGLGARIGNLLRNFQPSEVEETDDKTVEEGIGGTRSGDLETLQKLAELHASGVLSDAEFASAKAKVIEAL